ncbi:E3 ubiquitin-protein ligase TRIM71-like isoform X2 [Oppia nitens]|uniref:E3 ubiquitin-protein ligase TRIM71-like isoform X2 n=1 Tax=Oppia nitens TaxID=1686743 RepID=UPI0023DA8472|nr:E3 ubiquitin-protein ligase TRIM71-like isoform X2 [Oppia nitens]
MASNDETHILNLIRNLLIEEKERERLSSLRGGHSDALNLINNDPNNIVGSNNNSSSSASMMMMNNNSLPPLSTLSDLVVVANNNNLNNSSHYTNAVPTATYTTHTNNHYNSTTDQITGGGGNHHHQQQHHHQLLTNTGLSGYGLSRPTPSSSSAANNLSFLNITTPFDYHGLSGSSSGNNHSTIGDLLGLGTGIGGCNLTNGSRNGNCMPPLVSPLAHSSRHSSAADDSSDVSHQLLASIANSYPPMVSTPSSSSMSNMLNSPFLLDTISCTAGAGGPVAAHTAASMHSSSSSSSSTSSTLMSRFESQIRTIANDIQTTIQLHLNGLQMRKEQLLKQLEHIKQTYATVLSIAAATQSSSADSLDMANLGLALPQITFTRPDSALYKAVTTLGFLTTPALAVNCNATGDGVEAAIEGEATCFTITTRNCFNEELLIGGEHLDVEILVTDPTTSNTTTNNNNHNNGKYTVTYTIPRGVGGLKLGQVHISVAVNGLPISGAPFIVGIESKRVRNAWKRIATFGSEGSQMGQFCRPWGVAIVRLPNKDGCLNNLDHQLGGGRRSSQSSSSVKEYLIAVADRSNNRIQLLKLTLTSNGNGGNSNGNTNGGGGGNGQSGGNNSFNNYSMNSGSSSGGGGGGNTNNGGNEESVSMSVLHVFGSGPGNRQGQFDRPAGIAINVNLGHIIVADKDNHRVQVFDISGTYLFKFGEKGSRPGQFCYPWDIDSCPQTSQILVSDTRNRRVQLFTPYGQYLWHCGQPLDSPRGVSFISSDKFVISDFNKHRLLIIDKNVINSKEDVAPKYIGFGEGSAWGEFLRPQGVVSSGATAIYCADSRNNRISIWNSATQSFDYLGEDILALDRPSGLAVADNLLVVVDFGNNRIQICQR